MKIKSAVDGGQAVVVTDEAGSVLFIPKEEGNRDYREVLVWQAAGGVIEPQPDVPAPPETGLSEIGEDAAKEPSVTGRVEVLLRGISGLINAGADDPAAMRALGESVAAKAEDFAAVVIKDTVLEAEPVG